MAVTHRIYLIPGFFGFANFGELKYFAHVRDQLDWELRERGHAVELHYVATLPTASLRKRAARVVETIAETAGDDTESPIHLVGHSTGGIDARLVTSPGASLPCAHALEPIAARVQTVVCIASPHYGAPQAGMFASVLGQSLLKALSLLTVHAIRLGSVPLPALVALAGALPRTGPMKGPVLSIVEQVYRQLLKDFDKERQQEIEEFFAASREDQTLLPQLAPEGMDIFNAATTARPGVRYGSVLACGRPPAWRSTFSIGLAPAGQATYALYRALYELASTLPKSALPPLTADQRAAVRAAYGEMPSPAANDAIVPVLSQVYGDVVHAAWADHLDVIGHFGDTTTNPVHVDWLTTRSKFDRKAFDRLWSDVASYLVRA